MVLELYVGTYLAFIAKLKNYAEILHYWVPVPYFRHFKLL